jgi:hypothetical protein
MFKENQETMSVAATTTTTTTTPPLPPLVSQKLGASEDPYLTNLQEGHQYLIDNAGFVGAATALEKTSHLGREIQRGISRIPIFYVGIFSYFIAWVTAFIGQFIAASVIISMLGLKQPLPDAPDTMAFFFIGFFVGCIFGRILHKRLRICNSKISDKGQGSVCGSFEDCTDYTPDAWSLRLVDKFRKENVANHVTDVISSADDPAHAGLTEKQRKMMFRGPCHAIEFSWFTFLVRLISPLVALIIASVMFARYAKENIDSPSIARYYAVTMGISLGWATFAIFS